jgi:hypothetical protein
MPIVIEIRLVASEVKPNSRMDGSEFRAKS